METDSKKAGIAVDSQISLPDGRSLAFAEVGDAHGYPVFFFHGAPGSRLSLKAWTARFAGHGLRVICPDRPGYGGSSPQPSRAMADIKADLAHVADALGVDRFVVAGHSSGGPYAIACAALLPDRVAGAVALSGVTDMRWSGAWDGFFDTERDLMRLSEERSVEARCIELFGADGSRFLDAPGLDFSQPDLAALADRRIARGLDAAIREAFRQGVCGYAQDIFVQGRPWSFDAGATTAPTLVVHGDSDTIVPVGHSRHSAELIAGAVLRILPGHGHLSILAELPALCAELTQGAAPGR
jgi:pimeloyl-ACP methyl ester carboxylesterase